MVEFRESVSIGDDGTLDTVVDYRTITMAKKGEDGGPFT